MRSIRARNRFLKASALGLALGFAVAAGSSTAEAYTAYDSQDAAQQSCNAIKNRPINTSPDRKEPNVNCSVYKTRKGKFGIKFVPKPIENVLRTKEYKAGVARVKTKLNNRGFTEGSPVFIRSFKEEQKLEVWMLKDGQFRLFHTYDILKMSGGLGPKTFQGDKQVPEGFYEINVFNSYSLYGKSLGLNFPNALDRKLGYSGGDIMIHGFETSAGCKAIGQATHEVFYLTSKAREAGYTVHVHSFPFRMTASRMAAAKGSPHYNFWKTLQAGYDPSTTTQSVPRMSVANGKYVRTGTVQVVAKKTTPAPPPAPVPEVKPAPPVAVAPKDLPNIPVITASPVAPAPEVAEEPLPRFGFVPKGMQLTIEPVAPEKPSIGFTAFNPQAAVDFAMHTNDAATLTFKGNQPFNLNIEVTSQGKPVSYGFTTIPWPVPPFTFK